MSLLKKNVGKPAFGEGDFFTDLLGQYRNGKHIILTFVTNQKLENQFPLGWELWT